MLSAIGDFLINIWEAISQFFDMLISTIKDILIFVGSVISVPEMLRQSFTWLPSIVGNVVFTFLLFIIVLRVIKFLGD